MHLCAYAEMKVLAPAHIDLVAARARALGDPTRVRIILALSRGEQAVGQLADATSTQQSNVSKHLQVLFQAGLVQRRRSAATVYYSLASEDLVDWLRYLSAAQLSESAAADSARVAKQNAAAPKRRAR